MILDIMPQNMANNKTKPVFFIDKLELIFYSRIIRRLDMEKPFRYDGKSQVLGITLHFYTIMQGKHEGWGFSCRHPSEADSTYQKIIEKHGEEK